MNYVRVTGVTVEGRRASHRLPAADKKRKHQKATKNNTSPSALQLMKGDCRGEVEGGGRGGAQQWSECLKERGWTVQSKEVSLTHHPPRIPLNKTFFSYGSTCIYTQHLKSETMCACALCVYVRVHPPPTPHPNLSPCGWGRKGDGWNLVVSVYLLYLSLLSERNKSHVGDAAWGLRVHPSSSSSPHPLYPSIHPPTPISHLFPAPHKDSIEERQCFVDV